MKNETATLTLPLGHEDICRLLPHRYPFLLVDEISAWEPRERVVGLKNVSANEEFFQGHFPGYPVMPGVLIIEAMAQVAGLLAMETYETPTGFFYLAGIEKVRFRRAVRPGDALQTEVTLRSLRKSLFKTHAIARVGNEVAAEGEFIFVISDNAASSLILKDTIHRDITKD